jgi:hypothetical protein
MTALQVAVGVQHHGSDVTHRVRIGVVEDSDVVAGG